LTSVVASAFWYVFSAKGAAFTSKPGAAPQDYGNPKTTALKARFTSSGGSRLNRAFSAYLHGYLDSWGDAPGSPRRIRPVADWFEITPLALNKNPSQERG
jgi:hypothetical protein